jgi:hypothetical protein
VLREEGHLSCHWDLPLFVDEGEHCLLLARDSRGALDFSDRRCVGPGVRKVQMYITKPSIYGLSNVGKGILDGLLASF